MCLLVDPVPKPGAGYVGQVHVPLWVAISSYLGMGQNVFLTVPTSVLLWKYCLVKVYFFFLPGGVSDFFLPTLKYVTHVTNLSGTKKVPSSVLRVGLLSSSCLPSRQHGLPASSALQVRELTTLPGLWRIRGVRFARRSTRAAGLGRDLGD